MIYRLHKKICLNTDLSNAWNFFCNPKNLQIITPPSLNMKIIAGSEEEIYPGMIIKYHVHPILGFPMTWITEITQVNKPLMFVDEQRYGPYRMWHHQHIFKAIPEGGVLAEDIIDYIMPYGPIGSLAHKLFVSSQIEAIFEFRRKVLTETFGSI